MGVLDLEPGPPDVIVDMMPEEEYFKLLRSLNKSQREIFLYILHKMKVQSSPFLFTP
jgi:hypothetical protein